MYIKSLKITFVSGFNFLSKNLLVFVIFDLFENSNEYLYVPILIYMYLQSYILHLKFTLKRKIGVESFAFIFKIKSYFIFAGLFYFFALINQFFPYVVLSTIFISIIIHLFRIILFSKVMD